MRFFTFVLFILFHVYLIESTNRTESEVEKISGVGFESEKSEAREKSDNLDEVIYDEYEDVDDGSQENSISGKSENLKENSTESSDGFPNEVFLSLRNITADAATAFRSFTNRNDVVDLQASASDNLNVTSNDTLGDTLEEAGINLRALRDAGHPPEALDESPNGVYLPYKHAKIDTADLSDCALQGEWKPMGVAHGHLQVGGDASHQAEVLQSVGSYSVPSKIIPHWQQNYFSGSEQDVQEIHGVHNHKPSAAYTAAGGGSGNGNGYGSGFGGNAGGGGAVGGHSGFHHGGGVNGFGGPGSLGQFQKIKSGSMLAPPPIPPIIFGKKPGYWKSHKSKHKYFHGKGKRPSGGFGFSGHVNHGGGGVSGGYLSVGGGGGGHSIGGSSLASGHFSHGGHSGSHGGLGYGAGGGGGGGGGGVFSGQLGHGGSGGGGGVLSGQLGHGGGGGSGGVFSGQIGHGGGAAGGHSISGTVLSGQFNHGGSGYGNGGGGVLSISGSSGHATHGGGGGAATGHLISSAALLSDNSAGTGDEESLASVSVIGGGASGGHSLGGSSGYTSYEGGSGAAGAHLLSGSHAGAANGISASGHGSGGGGHLLSGSLISSAHSNQGVAAGGDNLIPEAAFLSSHLSHGSGGGNPLPDSTFSSSHINQGLRGGNSLPDAAFLSSHISQDFAVHGQGVSDDSSSSSTFTCGKNHDHNTNYHTATFQVADHDHPSSVDVLQYGGDGAVLIQSGDAPFHDQILPERKLYKTWGDKGDTEVSGSDARSELTVQAAQLTSQPTEPEAGQTEAEQTKAEDGEEPERHSYYHEITKVTKIPATSVGAVQYTYSEYETKPQSFSQETETEQEEPEADQPQIIRELEHLSNKFQLDVENPQKLFEDPPSQELAYHYPFHGAEHHEEGERHHFDSEQIKINDEVRTEFPHPIPHLNKVPVVYNKRPPIKYIPRPGKPQFYQKTAVNYLQPKAPVVVLRKNKPKQFIIKKQNYEVHEQGGERHRPLGEIFPPQKFPKQFHNPKPNFAVDRPKSGWRPGPNENLHQDYKYDYSHGKSVKKFKHKQKILAPVLIRRPVQKITPVIRVVEVSG